MLASGLSTAASFNRFTMLLHLALMQTCLLSVFVGADEIHCSSLDVDNYEKCPCFDIDKFRPFVPSEFGIYLDEIHAWYWQNSTNLQLRPLIEMYMGSYEYRRIKPLLAENLLQGLMKNRSQIMMTEWRWDYHDKESYEEDKSYYRHKIEYKVNELDYEREVENYFWPLNRLVDAEEIFRYLFDYLSRDVYAEIHKFNLLRKKATAGGANSLSETISESLQCWGFHSDLGKSIQSYVELIEWVADSIDDVENLDLLKLKYPQLLPLMERLLKKYLSESEVDKLVDGVKEVISTHKKALFDNMDGIAFVMFLDYSIKSGELPGFSNYASMQARSIDQWISRVLSSKSLLKTLGLVTKGGNPGSKWLHYADFVTNQLNSVYQQLQLLLTHIKDDLDADVEDEGSLAEIPRWLARLLKKIDYHQLSEAILPEQPNCFKNTTTEVVLFNRKLAYPELFLYHIIKTAKTRTRDGVIYRLLNFIPDFLF